MKMSCKFASKTPFYVFPNTNQFPTQTRIGPECVSFTTRLTKSSISNRNVFGSGRTRHRARIQAFYAPVETRETLYELLGIADSGTTLSDIKKAYKQMARKYHPDVSPPERVDEYTRRFIMVQEAYETLSNPQRRALYDRDLAKGLGFGFSPRKPYQYDDDKKMEEKGEWKMRWQSQLDELKRRSMNPSKGNSWGARMRAQRS